LSDGFNLKKMSKKVTIEITSNGWTINVHNNDNVLTENHVATMFGSECHNPVFESSDEISDDLYEAIDSFSNYDVMRALVNES
jgi:hypothetical protein